VHASNYGLSLKCATKLSHNDWIRICFVTRFFSTLHLLKYVCYYCTSLIKFIISVRVNVVNWRRLSNHFVSVCVCVCLSACAHHNPAAPAWRHNSNDVITSPAQAATLASTTSPFLSPTALSYLPFYLASYLLLNASVFQELYVQTSTRPGLHRKPPLRYSLQHFSDLL